MSILSDDIVIHKADIYHSITVATTDPVLIGKRLKILRYTR